MVAEKGRERVCAAVGREIDEVRDGIRRQEDRQMMREVSGRARSPPPMVAARCGSACRATWKRAAKSSRFSASVANQRRSASSDQHVEQHETARDLCRTGGPAMAMVGVADRGIQLPAVEVIDMPAVGASTEPRGEPARDERRRRTRARSCRTGSRRTSRTGDGGSSHCAGRPSRGTAPGAR